jgi:hypothetical protein
VQKESPIGLLMLIAVGKSVAIHSLSTCEFRKAGKVFSISLLQASSGYGAVGNGGWQDTQF